MGYPSHDQKVQIAEMLSQNIQDQPQDIQYQQKQYKIDFDTIKDESISSKIVALSPSPPPEQQQQQGQEQQKDE